MLSIVADCKACCYLARIADKLESMPDGSYASGTTHWLSPLDKPRCLLEQLARAMFQAHTAGLEGQFDPSTSGAEWWVLTIDSEEDVGFHWDKDFLLEEETGENRTPAIATVTYFSEMGSPTLMLEKSPPLRLGDPVDDGDPGVSRGWLSFPTPGKHVAFDGRWLHGAPTELRHKPTVRGRRKRPRVDSTRVSLLVNVWLDHKPGLASRMPADMAARLSPCLKQTPFGLDVPSDVEIVARMGGTSGVDVDRNPSDHRRAGVTDAVQELSWPIAQESDMGCALYAKLPVTRVRECGRARTGMSLELNFDIGDVYLFEGEGASS